jgi:hypothetical protein
MTSRHDSQKPDIPPLETSQTLSGMLMGFRITQMIYVVMGLSSTDLPVGLW